ncbi:pupal cuticle protein Edg-84A-like [Thrips palmi]|uniref:Pupal cuticle protein Edg-84A-like n=1 Tax=Thrips palmi TaxID=161013 RepID=A0A6P8YG71_THRPL|nr:pupal cuticle protein Edg-84A-like [Thrips palmi]
MARLTILALVALTTAACVSASHHGHHHDYYAKPKYHFKYGVDDPKHGDHHSQWEERDGDKVKGGYTVKEADGTWRHVTYTSDKENGFNAVVERRGKANHPYGHHGHHSHHGHHAGHLKADFVDGKADFTSTKANFRVAKADFTAPKADTSATHESLENYPDGAYGYIS